MIGKGNSKSNGKSVDAMAAKLKRQVSQRKATAKTNAAGPGNAEERSEKPAILYFFLRIPSWQG